MKFLAGICVALLALSALAAEKMTAVTIDGTSYVQIQEVRVIDGKSIVLFYASGGVTLAVDKFPKGFLASWGITTQVLAEAKAKADEKAEQALAKAVHEGLFREVDGIVYDMRKPQPEWRNFPDAKILQVIEDGALVDPTPYQATTAAVLVRQLPHYADNDKATFKAKATGEFSYINKYGFEHTIHAYDAGRICLRNEIPDAIVIGGQSSAKSPFAGDSKGGSPAPVSQHGERLRGIGSGFFITSDGYLLTNFHVVKEADSLEVEHRGTIFQVKVVEVDPVHDLALLKVSGIGFTPLAIARKDSAELGDAVFTIGFPNIEMQGRKPKFTDGKISSLTGMLDDTAEYQISVPVQPGNSGGPLCDTNGQVVGIVVARLNDMVALRESGAVPQNVNYAVKASLALPLLQRVKGLDALVLPATPDAKPAKPVQAVENAVAMILIY